MTGYESKRAAARDRMLDDDDTQVYQDHPAQEPVATLFGTLPVYDTTPPQPAQEPYGYVWFDKHMEHRFTRMKPQPDMGATNIKSIYTTPPQPAQEPWRESASDYERGFIDGMQKQSQSSVDKAVNAMTQRTWVGLANHDWNSTPYDTEFRAGAEWAEAKLKEKNT
jgi:hypothetical protein